MSDSDTKLSFNGISNAIKINRLESLSILNSIIEKDFKIDHTVETLNYTPVSIQSLQYLDKMQTFVYIKLNSGKYLKLFQPYDQVTEADFIKYKNKGLNWLFFKKTTHTWMLKQLDQQFESIVKNPKSSISFDPNHNPDDDIVTDSFEFESKPVTIDGLSFDFDQSVITDIPEKMDLIKEKIKKNQKLKAVLNTTLANKKLETFIETRTNLLIHFSCAIANELDWNSRQIIDKLIYTAFAHDAALFKYPKILIYDSLGRLNNELSLLTPFEKELFKNHTSIIIKLLEQEASVPKETLDLIAQHHERSFGGGFPLGIDYKRMNFLGAVFNVALELSNSLMQNSDLNYKQWISDRQTFYKGDSFRKTLKALSKIVEKQKL